MPEAAQVWQGAVPASLRRFVLLLRSLFFDRSDVQPGNGDAALIIKPNQDAAALRIDAGVVGARNAVASATACDNNEGLERSRV